MRRVKTAVVILVGLMVISVTTAVGLQDMPVLNDDNDRPFGVDPRDAFDYVPPNDFVITLRTAALVPGSLIIAGLGMSFQVDPFFTNSQTDFTVLPTFVANHSLETGLSFSWWSASADVDLSIAPWALTATGGWLGLHPPEWTILRSPWVTLEGKIGWRPRWAPVDGWSHTLGGTLDVQAAWKIPTLWDSPLDLTAESNLDAAWTFPTGVFVTNCVFGMGARSTLPLFQDNQAALRAGVKAQVFLLPTFGFGFDIELEFRANAFYAYGLVGAGSAGIRAEVGAEITIGLTLFEGLD